MDTCRLLHHPTTPPPAANCQIEQNNCAISPSHTSLKHIISTTSLHPLVCIYRMKTLKHIQDIRTQ